jgi:hypothetical protein
MRWVVGVTPAREVNCKGNANDAKQRETGVCGPIAPRQ